MSQWYVMLFPTEEEMKRLFALFQDLAKRFGGRPTPTPHVTVGYFRGVASASEVIPRLHPLIGPPVTICASGVCLASEKPHPVFGHTLSFAVRRDEGVERWQRQVRAVLSMPSLAPTYTWEEQTLHVQALQNLPDASRETLARLEPIKIRLTFRATRLVVSQCIGDGLVTWLDQPLISPPVLGDPT